MDDRHRAPVRSPRPGITRALALVAVWGLALGTPETALAQGLDVDLFAGLGGGMLSSTDEAVAGSRGSGRALLELGGAVSTPVPGLAVAGAAALGFGGVRGLETGGWLGVRSTFGRDAIATWVDLDAAFRIGPRFDLGPRFAFGARWEFLPALAAYGALSGQLGFVNGLRGDLGLTFGIMGLFSTDG